eukprot:COSAG05_NODE_1729_length_4192_cov_1.698510_5_plen_96_part_00
MSPAHAPQGKPASFVSAPVAARELESLYDAALKDCVHEYGRVLEDEAAKNRPDLRAYGDAASTEAAAAAATTTTGSVISPWESGNSVEGRAVPDK